MTQKVEKLATVFLAELFKLEIPFPLRYMLKIVHGLASQCSADDRIHTYLLTDLLAGCYLSNGFRWAEAMWGCAPTKQEALLQGHIL